MLIEVKGDRVSSRIYSHRIIDKGPDLECRAHINCLCSVFKHPRSWRGCWHRSPVLNRHCSRCAHMCYLHRRGWQCNCVGCARIAGYIKTGCVMCATPRPHTAQHGDCIFGSKYQLTALRSGREFAKVHLGGFNGRECRNYLSRDMSRCAGGKKRLRPNTTCCSNK